MKRIFSFLAVLLAFCSALVWGVAAALVIGNYNMTAITTASTNSPTFVTNTAYFTLPQITVTNNSLSATNSYTGSFRWSFDNVTFFTNGSPQFNPATTAATNTVISAQGVTVPVYIQLIAFTNSLNLSNISIGAQSP